MSCSLPTRCLSLAPLLWCQNHAKGITEQRTVTYGPINIHSASQTVNYNRTNGPYDDDVNLRLAVVDISTMADPATLFFFLNDPATPEFSPLPLHDALPS